jgi:hypothetical protein
MTTQRLRPVLINELLDALFSGAAHELHDCCARWCASSPHFATFLDRYRDKIRKKLRGVTDGEGLRDLRAELRTAACLLSERAFTLEYEKYAANKTRGPDFSLLFKTHIPFNVEVKRIRGQVQPGKWADVLCYKLGQLPPSISNALVVYGESLGQGAPFDVGAAMAQLRASAERKDEAFFTRRGLEGSREYLRQLPKLSVVVVLQAETGCESSAPLASWINPQARHPLAPDLGGALLRSLEAL